VELQEHPAKRKQGKKMAPVNALRSADENAIEAILGERSRFHRFLTARVGDSTTAEDLLQDSLLRAIKQHRKLRRGESAVPWFYRILRNAVADHFRRKGSESRRVEKLLGDMQARGDDVAVPPADWDAAVCACFRGLIPALKPRYAEVIRRVDLQGEPKLEVARALKITRATMDVLLHRARVALRERLEILCGACSRAHCRECFCERRAREKV